jgi:poly-beta-1,6-N-acetyl-D-glucosamine biosynthesis protein PgaD
VANDLIINARRKLGWRRRILSDVSTVVLWVTWLYLWMPVLRKLLEVIRLKLRFKPAAIEVLETVDPISITHSLVMLVGTCALLMLWTLLPKRQVTHAHEVTTLDDYGRAFNLPTEAIVAGRSSRIITVHSDDEGAIVRLESQS